MARRRIFPWRQFGILAAIIIFGPILIGILYGITHSSKVLEYSSYFVLLLAAVCLVWAGGASVQVGPGDDDDY